jgi:hypothetical protein
MQFISLLTDRRPGCDRGGESRFMGCCRCIYVPALSVPVCPAYFTVLRLRFDLRGAPQKRKNGSHNCRSDTDIDGIGAVDIVRTVLACVTSLYSALYTSGMAVLDAL